MGNSIENLYFKSKTISLVILAATAVVCVRMLFVLFNDPEGPNLLIITVLTLAVYGLSIAAYLFGSSAINGIKRLSAVVCMQILLVAVLYFFMK